MDIKHEELQKYRFSMAQRPNGVDELESKVNDNLEEIAKGSTETIAAEKRIANYEKQLSKAHDLEKPAIQANIDQEKTIITQNNKSAEGKAEAIRQAISQFVAAQINRRQFFIFAEISLLKLVVGTRDRRDFSKEFNTL